MTLILILVKYLRVSSPCPISREKSFLPPHQTMRKSLNITQVMIDSVSLKRTHTRTWYLVSYKEVRPCNLFPKMSKWSLICQISNKASRVITRTRKLPRLSSWTWTSLMHWLRNIWPTEFTLLSLAQQPKNLNSSNVTREASENFLHASINPKNKKTHLLTSISRKLVNKRELRSWLMMMRGWRNWTITRTSLKLLREESRRASRSGNVLKRCSCRMIERMKITLT